MQCHGHLKIFGTSGTSGPNGTGPNLKLLKSKIQQYLNVNWPSGTTGTKQKHDILRINSEQRNLERRQENYLFEGPTGKNDGNFDGRRRKYNLRKWL